MVARDAGALAAVRREVKDFGLGKREERRRDHCMVDLLRVPEPEKRRRRSSALPLLAAHRSGNALVKAERVALLWLLDQKLDHVLFEPLKRLSF